MPLSRTGAELLFEVFSQRYEHGTTLVTSNLPFDEWTSVFGSERLTGALLNHSLHHVTILEMNGDSYRLAHSKRRAQRSKSNISARRRLQKVTANRMKAPARRGLHAFKTDAISLRTADAESLRR